MENRRGGIRRKTNSPSNFFPSITIYLFFIVVLLGGTTINVGCGYHNPYVMPEQGSLPPAKLYFEIWPNRTNELGLESKIYRTLRFWFKKSKIIHTTTDKNEADFLLEGEIVSINLPGLSYGTFDRAVEVKAILKVRYALKQNRDGKILWEVPAQVFEEAIVLGNDPSTTRGSKKKALALISDDLAEAVYLKTHDTLSMLH